MGICPLLNTCRPDAKITTDRPQIPAKSFARAALSFPPESKFYCMLLNWRGNVGGRVVQKGVSHVASPKQSYPRAYKQGRRERDLLYACSQFSIRQALATSRVWKFRQDLG